MAISNNGVGYDVQVAITTGTGGCEIRHNRMLSSTILNMRGAKGYGRHKSCDDGAVFTLLWRFNYTMQFFNPSIVVYSDTLR